MVHNYRHNFMDFSSMNLFARSRSLAVLSFTLRALLHLLGCCQFLKTNTELESVNDSVRGEQFFLLLVVQSLTFVRFGRVF